MKQHKILFSLILLGSLLSIGAIFHPQVQEIGDLILSADSNGDGIGQIKLQTNNGIDRVVVENNGDIVIGRMGIDEPKITFSTLEPTVGYGLNIGHAYFDGLRNDLAQFGYNCGAKTNPLLRKFCIEIESQYRGNGGEWAELHLRPVSSLEGINTRPLSFAFNWLNGESILQYNGHFSVADFTGTIGRFYVGGGAIQSTNNTPFLIGNNNFAGIKQKSNVAGTYYTLIYLDSSNNINISSSADNRPVNIPTQLNVNGQKIIGTRCGAIPDSSGTVEDNKRAINALLACMKGTTGNHQLVAQ